MRITIAAVGKIQSTAPEQLLIQQYQKRTPWNIDLREVVAKKQSNPAVLAEEESRLLINAIPAKAKRIVLDERGKILSSEDFAKTISRWQDDGIQDLAFVIGGAAGHGKIMRSEADMLLSLGKMTWPHMMVRSLLVEQLYRAYTIISGHPYHK